MDVAGGSLILEWAGHDLDADCAVKVLETARESSQTWVPWWRPNDPDHNSEAHHSWCQCCYICPLLSPMLCSDYSSVLCCCVISCCSEEGGDDPSDHKIGGEVSYHHSD